MRTNLFFLILYLAANYVHAAKFDIVCSGKTYWQNSVFATESAGDDDTRVFQIDGNMLFGSGSNGVTCFDRGETQVVCMIPKIALPGEDGKSFSWDFNLNRITGKVLESTHTTYTSSRFLQEFPTANRWVMGASEVISSRVFKGDCKKVSGKKFWFFVDATRKILFMRFEERKRLGRTC